MKHNLFSYGTLQSDQVQIETFGRLLTGKKDILKNYKLEQLEITDKSVLQKSGEQFHPIAVRSTNPDDCIEGTIFEISEEELLSSDKYEVSDYRRVAETFESGKTAWIYVQNR